MKNCEAGPEAGEPAGANGYVSLADLLRFLAGAWRAALFGAAGGLIAATVYLAATPAEFQAEATIRLARLGNKPVESPGQTVERIKSPDFQASVLRALAWQQDANSILYRKSLVAVPRGVDEIRLSVRAFSPDGAARAIKVTAVELGTAGLREAQAGDDAARLELKSMLKEIDDLETSLAALRRMRKTIPEGSRLDLLMLMSIEGDKKARLFELQRGERALQTKVIPSDKQTVSLIDEQLPQDPISPKKAQVAILAILAGMFVAIITAGLWSGASRQRSTPSP